ncbi:MAG: hypothetical protein MJ092_07935, partial [Lachnospiraceae bacterium]|nr:hypothetical protein [Lachnospiraceae bacterium]
MNPKRKVTKRIAVWLMCLAMIMTLVPLNAVIVHAEDENVIYEVEAVGIKQPFFGIPKETLAEGNTYPLNVGNITVTDENASDITGRTLKNGYAHFNPVTNTLSLWNCTIDTTTSTYGIIWKSSEDLHVRLHGINYIVSESGIYTYGNLFLEGDGELRIKTPKNCINERHIGIRASTLTVCEAARIVINEPVEPECSGFKGENLVLKDNVTFTIDTAYVGLDLSKAEKCKLEMRNNAICNIFSSVKSGVLPFWVPKESEDSYNPDKKKFSIEMDRSIYLCVYGPTEYDDRQMGALSYFYYALDKPGMIYKTTDLTYQSKVSYTLDPSGSYTTGFEFYLVCYSILTDSDQTWRSDTYSLNYVLGSKPTDVISTTVPKRHSKATIMDCTRGKREADCRLVGWTYTEGSGQVDVSIGEILTLSKDVTLYPVWEYKVSLTGENANASVNDAPVQWVKAGEKVDLSVGDIATNKRFKSWQSGNVTIEQANQENAYFIMPSSAVQVTYALDSYINEMMVTGFAQPVENGLVSGYEVSLPQSENHIPYQIVTQQWKYADDSLCSGSFATTQPCKLCITVQAEEGYVFDEMSAIKVINELGGLETINNLILSVDHRTVSFETEGRGVQPQGSEISTIRVIGAQKPVEGDTALQGDALGLQVAGGLGYDLYVPYWSDVDGEAGNIFSGTFKDGHTYALVMEVRAQTGFTFAPKAGLSAIVNGTVLQVEDINYRNNTDVYLFVRYKLPAAIEQVEINGMGSQYFGDDSTQYQLTVPKNSGYYVKNAETGWYTDTDVPFTGFFENGKTYRFKVSLGLEAEQKFANMADMTCTFDGQPATIEQWDKTLNQYVLSREITIHDMVQARENIEPTCLYAEAKAYFKC